MGEVRDPWENASLVELPEDLLLSDWLTLVPALVNLKDSGFRIPVAQADVIFRRYLRERGKPYLHWMELDTILTTIALARHQKALEEIEEVFAMGEFDFTGVASRALLAWHGMPELFLVWVGEMDRKNFDSLPLAVQDYIRGVDLSATWERTGIVTYFYDASSDKIDRMAEAFIRMEMPSTAAALLEAKEWWNKSQAVLELNLDDEALVAAYDPLYVKWEETTWQMSDQKNGLLEGISRYAVKNARELRHASGWFEESPRS